MTQVERSMQFIISVKSSWIISSAIVYWKSYVVVWRGVLADSINICSITYHG